MAAGLFTFMNAMTLNCGTKTLDLSRPAVMGIVNITPDSFSDGGQLYAGEKVDLDKTLRTVESMLPMVPILSILAENRLAPAPRRSRLNRS